ncbi:MAG: DUF3604 domain-containing protein [Pseudomonadales bacterium]
MKILTVSLALALASATAMADDKLLLWGDTHLHTSNSFDAFLNNNVSADPDTAYRWAKGEPVIHPYNRARVQIAQPLDFLVVSDHAEFMGGIRDIYLNGIHVEDAGPIDSLIHWYTTRRIRQAVDAKQGAAIFNTILPKSENAKEAAGSWGESTGGALPVAPEVITNTWRQFATTADRHNEPGKFTAFIGWEWSSTPGGANLHRVVVSSANADSAAKFMPFTSTESPYPEDLWNWLAKTGAETGVDFLSIPHNSNVSKGLMFSDRKLDGSEMDADHARLRAQWERIAEVTQIKGDSETHPDLSPDDEFADFETYPYYLQQKTESYVAHPGDYLRSALRTGLALDRKLNVNPFALGLIGSTDSHTGLSSAEEPNFWGKMATDSIPENKATFTLSEGPTGWTMSASGLAAVWAEANTREAILAAMKRREVYATTGPRIRLRFYASADASLPAARAADATALPADWETLAGTRVPMGGELSPGASSVTFVVIAQQDPDGAPLDRAQIIKGWIDDAGETHEKVVDVAWSEPRDVANGHLGPVRDTVDRRTGRRAPGGDGAAELTAVWQDADATAGQKAFYYARVLQVPTARHSLLDAVALGEEHSQEGPDTIQERAYSSPIWINP